ARGIDARKRSTAMIRQILRGGRAGEAERATSYDDDAESAPSAWRAAPRLPIRWLDPPPGPWTLERSYQYCEEFARAHTESFPVASRLVPAEIRPHLVALYAFARSADDFAEEPQYEGRRAEALDRWEEELGLCTHGESTHPVFVALADTIAQRELPIPPSDDMLSDSRHVHDV